MYVHRGEGSGESQFPQWMAQFGRQARDARGDDGPPWSRGGHRSGGHGGFGHGPGGSGRPPWAAFFDQARGGPGGPFGGPFGGPGGGPFGGPRTTKARRGDVRLGVLSVLVDGSRNGYQLIQEIAERSGGAWKPSPGSVYPTLQQLEDEGLVVADRPEGRRTFDLTDEGRAYVEGHADELVGMWGAFVEAADDGHQDMRSTIGQVMGAAAQVAFAGSAVQRDQARQVLVDARRRLYQILADGNGDEPDETDETDGDNDGSGSAR